MNFETIITALNCEVLCRGTAFDNAEISHVAAGDLMSEVLVVDEEGLVIVTALTSDQVVRTADIVGAAGIIIVNGKPAQRGMKDLAAGFGITLLTTKQSMFRTCVSLGRYLNGEP